MAFQLGCHILILLMMFSIFGRAKRPPLTKFCTWLSAPATLLSTANAMYVGSSSGIDKRAIILSLVIVAAAGQFVGGLRWDQNKRMWEGSRRYLQNTNLDVITAEAIVWMYFLMRRLFETERDKEAELIRAGRLRSPAVLNIPQHTFPTASQIVLNEIEKWSGVDFKETGIGRGKRYEDALKEGEDISLVFASVVLHSVGRQSLADPMKDLGPAPLAAEWSPLSLNVTLFFSTMPLAFYETFKNFLKALDDEEFENLYR